MPVYQIKNVSESLKVGIWKIIETEEELYESLIGKGILIENKPNTPNKTRIKQWLTTRLLLSKFFKNAVISYDVFGKPHLDNGWFISVSHSNEFVSIIVNKNTHCGIDIEKVTPKIERIKHKFLNHLDLQNVTSLEQLTIYWGAKEVLYKYYGRKEVLFIENLFIEDFSENNSSFKGKIKMADFKVELSLAWEKIGDYILVYTL